MNKLTTGNNIVDTMATINITGNVIPQIWYKTVLRDNGKPYHLAIMILADIVYWYRPTEVRDESSGDIIGWKKRFKEDLLQRSYKQMIDTFGESKTSITNAIICLEKLGVIKRIFRTIETPRGIVLNNVLYLELFPDKLFEITYPESKSILVNNRSLDTLRKEKPCIGEHSDEQLQNKGTPIVEFKGRVSSNLETPIIKNDVEVSQKKVIPPSLTGKTNTKNITENNTRDYNNHINQSSIMDKEEGMDMINKCEDLVKSNIDYKYLMSKYKGGDIQEIDEIIALIVEVIGIERKSIRIAGAEYPYAIVRDKFLKINSEHIEYVFVCLHKNTTKINNIKAYLLTALFNSVNTINNSYTADVNHGRTLGINGGIL